MKDMPDATVPSRGRKVMCWIAPSCWAWSALSPEFWRWPALARRRFRF
jgi:hypothetical protein